MVTKVNTDFFNEFLNASNAKSILEHLHEKYYIELKAASSELPKSFWESYSAFCNTKGGWIILGVEEHNPTNIIRGVKNPNKITTDLWNLLSNPNKVNYNTIKNTDVRIINVNDAQIIVVRIEEAPIAKKPVYINNQVQMTWIRTDDGDRSATKEILSSLFRDANPVQDSLIANEFTLDDLDNDSLRSFKNIVNRRFPAKGYKNLSDSDFLIEIGAAQKDRSNGNLLLKKGTILFLGKVNSIQELFPHYHLDYFNYKGTNSRWSDRISDDEPSDIEFNLFNFFNTVFSKIRDIQQYSFRLDQGQTRIPEDPFNETLRECLANCLIHADYEQGTPSSKIEVYDGWYLFKNPGKMLVSTAQFIQGGESIPRNEIIMKLFRYIGISERQGFGGPTIYKSAKLNDYRRPEIISTIDYTEFKIWNIDLADSYSELSSEEKVVLRFIVKNEHPISIKEISTHAEITDYKTRQIVSTLVDKDLIKRVGSGPSTRYTVLTQSIEQLTQLQMQMDKLKGNL